MTEAVDALGIALQVTSALDALGVITHATTHGASDLLARALRPSVSS
ncbi:MAG: hypothetical protein RJA55_2995 [Acidobacteriota bacterium]|jgi:hypothetical protein